MEKRTERKLIREINRRLPEFQNVQTTEPGKYNSDLGDYYIVDNQFNTIVASHIDLEKTLAELNTLKCNKLSLNLHPNSVHFLLMGCTI